MYSCSNGPSLILRMNSFSSLYEQVNVIKHTVVIYSCLTKSTCVHPTIHDCSLQIRPTSKTKLDSKVGKLLICSSSVSLKPDMLIQIPNNRAPQQAAVSIAFIQQVIQQNPVDQHAVNVPTKHHRPTQTQMYHSELDHSCKISFIALANKRKKK